MTSNPGSAGKRHGILRLLWGAAFLVNLFVVGMVLLMLERNRQQEVNQAETLTENYSKILEESLAGFISKIDITLLTVAEEVERQLATGGIDQKALEKYIAHQDAHIPEALGLRVVDAQGIIRYAINDIKIRNASIADRPQFIRLRDDPQAGLVISKPILGRAADKWMVTLGRRINHPDGSFAGDVHVAVAVDHFIGMFAKLNLGENGNVGLWDKTTLIARYTKTDTHGATVGTSNPSSDLRALLASNQTAASYHTRSGVDGITRTFYYRQLGQYPLYLIVGLADEDYLAKWRKDSLNTVMLAGLFVLASLISSFLIGRAWKRREADRDALLRQDAAYTAKLEQYNRATDAAWRQSELILSSAAEGICGVDLAGRVIFVNPAARKMFGWDEEEGVGLDLHALTHHHDMDGKPYDNKDCQVFKTLQDGERRHVSDGLYWRKDGSSFPVEFTVSSIERDGRITGAVNVFRDISERKQIEAELERHHRHLEDLVQQRTSELMQTEARASHILHSSADGLYGIDCKGIITFINPAACAILGYKAEQVIGLPAHSLLHHSQPDGSPYPAADCPSYKALRLGQKVRVNDEVYWHADGHAVPVMYATHPMLQDGEITGAVTSFVDVSVQRAAAQAREQALIAAENLARVKSEFLANMSHEIRTPLNGVLGFAQIGYRNYQNSEKARDSFAKIQLSGNRLLGIINDILDFSKIEAGKLRIEQTEVVLSEVIEHALDLVRERAQAKQIDLRVELASDLPKTCISDPLRMGQVLLNILSNAVKFTEAGSVTLSLDCRDGMLVFKVTDTGIGMNAEQIGALFNPFHQADASASRKFGGTGLGLAISKRILELMNGNVSVNSCTGVGSSIEFCFPYVMPEGAAETQPNLQDEMGEGKKPLAGISILVADDEAINRMVLEEILVEYGAGVVLVENGQEAVARVMHDGRDAYDVVLMDIQMPEMDGFEATRRILEQAPDLPIIAQTAHAFNEEREKCFAAGMVDHIAKPIEPEALGEMIRQHVLVKP
ncbi:PAS domain S-box protein [Ferribacterium limneticum]|uniref:PAS domain S-box protein n=1 Tax=Ferribacterium limneticum TaxID=76259 RepID=UPI001CF9AE38|nr:PAS domain S-box protein [Ferribacterium limneticum]UCV30072.1 PAS domain S-box protein [Ferribacterium limneticum]UCV33991.1 PAS domain S-box protein [Ferribacterium limneticum]